MTLNSLWLVYFSIILLIPHYFSIALQWVLVFGRRHFLILFFLRVSWKLPVRIVGDTNRTPMKYCFFKKKKKKLESNHSNLWFTGKIWRNICDNMDETVGHKLNETRQKDTAWYHFILHVESKGEKVSNLLETVSIMVVAIWEWGEVIKRVQTFSFKMSKI